jgi:ubiquinone/menaquinone biosynthesis C-methylase UbiE
MIEVSRDTAISGHPVVYAGRFADQVSLSSLPDGCSVLNEWEVLPSQLAAALEQATTLVILDPFSFPFEAMTEDQLDIPLVVVMPPGFDVAFLATVFGEALLERLGFFDRVATADTDLLEQLRRRYRWAGSQCIEVGDARPGKAATEICARLEAEFQAPTFFGGDEYEAVRYWRERGDALAASVPHRAVCSVHHDPRFNKAVHRVQAEALGPQFDAARGDRIDAVFDVLEVGVGVGRWALAFDPAKTRFVGVDISGGMVEAARTNFPEGRFDLLDTDLLLPYADESFDLIFTVDVMHHNPTPAKLTLLSEMWRVAQPGGRLMFLENFVAEKRTPRSTVYPLSVLGFVGLILEATAGQVMLEHVESLRYPHDPFFRGGLLSVSKIGVPKTW